jgi:dCMP deaminase
VIDTHKPKYFKLYMDLAIRCSIESVAERLKVGSVLVTSNGMISIGWNGTPSGFDNSCEYPPAEVTGHRTRPEVIHAERNALDKVCREGVTVKGSLLFITHAPCVECAKSIHALGIIKVFYLSEHEGKTAGTELLHTLKIPCELFKDGESNRADA